MGQEIRVGRRMIEIHWDPQIRSIEDAIHKVLDSGIKQPSTNEGLDQNLEGSKETIEQIQQALEKPKQEQSLAPDGDIQGLQGNENESIPDEQPGTELTDVAYVGKSFFMDSFGINGGDLIELLKEGGEESLIPQVVDMLKNEQNAIMKTFDWWDDKDWSLLQLRDNDFNLLRSYPNRLELPLRQTLAALKRGDNIEKVWEQWNIRLNAEQRLSRRERNILSTTYDTIRKHGDMNALTLTSYGVCANTKELGSLIKSYGFLYDVKVVGQGKKSDDRTLYYGTNKPPIFLKAVGPFIGSLWEVGGSVEIGSLGQPRILLPFNTKRAGDYTTILKKELGVENITWEGRQFVFEGEKAVLKASQLAMPFLGEKESEVCILISAIKKNENAGRIMAYQQSSLKKQPLLLKKWNVSEEEIEKWKEVIINDY